MVILAIALLTNSEPMNSMKRYELCLTIVPLFALTCRGDSRQSPEGRYDRRSPPESNQTMKFDDGIAR